MRSALPILTVSLTAFAAAGCTGTIAAAGSGDLDMNTQGPPGERGGAAGAPRGVGGGSGAGLGAGGAVASSAGQVGPMPLRVLTHEEYSRTVRDLLGDETAPGQALRAEDSGAHGFITPTPIESAGAVRDYMERAQEIAARALQRPAVLVPCASRVDATPQQENACLAEFLASFGSRAFRRPVTATETARFTKLYADLRAPAVGFGFLEALGGVLQAVLQSPSFLYRWELGEEPLVPVNGVVPLTAYQLASRLSYLLWGTMPDDELFRAARDRTLLAPDELERQATRMLRDARARDGMGGFFLQVVAGYKLDRTEKLRSKHPGWGPELIDAMKGEVTAVVSAVLLQGDGKLSTLFTAPNAMVNAALAQVYGLPDVRGTGFQPRTLERPRAGLLTLPAFLAVHALPDSTLPVTRGAFVRNEMLCQEVHLPVGLDPQPLPDPVPNQSRRDQSREHASSPACAGCHLLLDPLGYAFEHFDEIGRLQTEDGGKPVDASGVLVGLASGEVRFDGAPALMKAIVASAEFSACFARKWLVYTLGREVKEETDGRSIEVVARALRRTGGDVRALFAALVRSDAFRYRALSDQEVP